MIERVLQFVCCPECCEDLTLDKLEDESGEVGTGVLSCSAGHFYPIVGGIPRMLPDSMAMNWSVIDEALSRTQFENNEQLRSRLREAVGDTVYDKRTQANFSHEWDNHDIGAKTWTMELEDRVKWFFINPIRIDANDLAGKIVLDAGCGNGSQSVAYTAHGLEVIAIDLSTGLEKGYKFRERYLKGNPEKVHFIQADLQKPPLRKNVADIIHSAGVLHHTPNTEKTFRALRPILKPGGTFYVWLYKYESVVTPIVNAMRTVTTRIPAGLFARIADVGAIPFIGFCWLVDRLGIRSYEIPDRREATIAVHDIFGAPYAHYHDFEEVKEWFVSEGIEEVWPCNSSRRGFGVCGRWYNKGKKVTRK